MRRPFADTLEGFIKIPATLLLLGGLFYGAYWYLAIHLPDQRRARDDPAYAGTVFRGILEFETVLASRRWHRRGAEAWDCSYAIVALPEGAALTPPDATDRDWFVRFGGDWLPTPTSPLGETTRDAVGFCAQYFNEDLTFWLMAALAEPGS